MFRNNSFKLSVFLVLIMSVFSALPVFAGTASVSGSLDAGDPLFNRPFTCGAVSGVGTNVHYDTHTFEVDTAGNYTMEVTSFGGGDSVLVLYQIAFNPADVTTNCIAYNDDFAGLLSAITHPLTSGTTYILVMTTFGNGTTGAYTIDFNGVGNICLGTCTPAITSSTTTTSSGPFIDPSTIPPDDRLNYGRGDSHMGILYARSDNGITIYGVNPDSSGYLAVHVAPEDLPDCDPAPSENQLLASSADGKYTVWLLTTCEYQANIGPDAEGKVQVITWRGVPADKDSVTSYDFNVFEVLGG